MPIRSFVHGKHFNFNQKTFDCNGFAVVAAAAAAVTSIGTAKLLEDAVGGYRCVSLAEQVHYCHHCEQKVVGNTYPVPFQHCVARWKGGEDGCIGVFTASKEMCCSAVEELSAEKRTKNYLGF
jgi:hypothetical protein